MAKHTLRIMQRSHIARPRTSEGRAKELHTRLPQPVERFGAAETEASTVFGITGSVSPTDTPQRGSG